MQGSYTEGTYGKVWGSVEAWIIFVDSGQVFDLYCVILCIESK